MNINQLPDDCLRHLFSQYFTLSELIHLRTSICPHWFGIIDQIFLSQRSLDLFNSYHSLTYFNDRFFKYANSILSAIVIKDERASNTIMPKQSQILPALFPTITSLRIQANTTFHSIYPVWFEGWAPTLEKLLIFDFPRENDQVEALFGNIYQMKSLKTLFFFRLYKHQIPDRFPILNQLKFFLLIHYLSDIVPVLTQLTSISELDLSWIYLSSSQMGKILSLNPAMQTSLTSLTLGFISAPSGAGDRVHNFQKLFKFVCHNFHELKSFDLLFADHVSIQ